MNNFDQSSSGINIELNAYYDRDLAYIYYDDFLNDEEVTKIADDLFFLGDANKSFFKRWRLEKMKKADILSNYDFIFVTLYYIDEEDTKNAIIDEMVDLTNEEVVTKLWEESNWHSFGSKVFDLGFDYSISRGYSQGDAVYIVRDNSDQHYKDQDIDQILWDIPIHCKVTINDDKEIYLSDLDGDLYKWDEDSAIQLFSEHITKDQSLSDKEKLYINDWLKDNLPSELEYNY